MTIERAIKIMKSERNCVEAESKKYNSGLSGINYSFYQLELPTNEILEAYDLAISVLEYQQMIGRKL